MQCGDCRELLSGHLDGELMAAESQNVRDHLAHCAECAREEELLARTSVLVRQRLVRHSAPDVLKARIRTALARAPTDRADPLVRPSPTPGPHALPAADPWAPRGSSVFPAQRNSRPGISP